MAGVRIHDHEESGEALPRVCMRCGAPATGDVPASFGWVPNWVYFLLFCGPLPMLIAMVFTRKSSSILVPVCDRHVNHWRFRQMLVGVGILGAVAMFIGFLSQSDKLDPDTYKFAATAVGVLAAVWLISVLVVERRAIRATHMTDKWTDLANVSPDFVTALKLRRDAAVKVPTQGAKPKQS